MNSSYYWYPWWGGVYHFYWPDWIPALLLMLVVVFAISWFVDQQNIKGKVR